MHGGTGAQTSILRHMGAILTSAVASNDCHLWFSVGNGHTQKVGHLPHHVSTANGTVQSFDATLVGSFHQRVGHSATTSEATASTVGTREQSINLGDAGVFNNSKTLGADIEHKCRYESDGSKNNYCDQNRIHKDII